MTRTALLAVTLALSWLGAACAGAARYDVLGFADLAGWETDDHASALRVFNETCPDMNGVDWQALCALAQQGGLTGQDSAARTFFELFFRPVLISDGASALFTGYFEPELEGALQEDARFRYPLYRMPPEVQEEDALLTRRDIVLGEVMKDRGLEIVWVDDPVELFFLQIQGSGRIRLRDGSVMRVGYGGSNGQEYRSIGAELVRRGIYELHQVSAEVIKTWVRENPEDGPELLMHNPSYVFFRVVDDLPAGRGPLGAMNRSITAGRSIAIDPVFVPLGAPVWVEKDGEEPLQRLMIAQDTGAAIKGAQRGDLFIGTGAEAGRLAGRLRASGRLLVLMPIQRAYALASDVLQ